MSDNKPPRFGKLEPRYRFILNPYPQTRVSTCPGCEKRMHQRKLPLFIHVYPIIPIILGYTCRYCPDCDLLVAHQDEIEKLLTFILQQHAPEAVGNKYLVLGTVERDFWRQGMKTPRSFAELTDHLHDFKEVWTMQFSPAGWYPKGVIEAKEREIARARAAFAAHKAQATEEQQLAASSPAQHAQKRKRSKR